MSRNDAWRRVSSVTATSSAPLASFLPSQFMADYFPLNNPSSASVVGPATIYPIPPDLRAIQANYAPSGANPNTVSRPFGAVFPASNVDLPMPNPQAPILSSAFNSNPGLFLSSVNEGISPRDPTAVIARTNSRLGQGAQSDLRSSTTSGLVASLRFVINTTSLSYSLTDLYPVQPMMHPVVYFAVNRRAVATATLSDAKVTYCVT
ncbi:hypothetical protein BDW68DRAFT_181659 [Aspergillus falconensis]